MRLRNILLVCLVILGPQAFSQEVFTKKSTPTAPPTSSTTTQFLLPPIKVLGAEEPIPPGEIILMKVADFPEIPPNLVELTYCWKVLENGKEKKRVWYKGQEIFFGAGLKSTRYTVLLNVVGHFQEKDAGGILLRSAVKVSEIIVTDVVVGQPPDPIDPVDPIVPDPVFPDGEFGLAKLAYQWAKETVTLQQKDKVRTANALGGSFSSVSSAIAAGALKEGDVILKTLRTSNNNALGANAKDWDNWGSKFQDYVYKLHVDGKLNTPDQWKKALSEVSVGLMSIK